MVLRRAGLWAPIAAWIDQKKALMETESQAATRTTRAQAKADDSKAKESEEILTVIGLTIDPSQYQHIQDCADGIAAWSALAELYEKNSRANRISLKREFYGFDHDTIKPIQNYISGISRLATALRAIGVKVTQQDEVDVLIFNLSSEWGNVAATLSASSAELTVADVTGALLDEEGRRGGAPPDETALMARAPKIWKSPKITCYRCHRRGHMVKDCPEGRKGDTAHVAVDSGYAF